MSKVVLRLNKDQTVALAEILSQHIHAKKNLCAILKTEYRSGEAQELLNMLEKIVTRDANADSNS
jgi:hypothetical protein